MQPQPEEKSVWKNPLAYTSGLIVLALLYVGYTFYSRGAENRAIEQKIAAEKQVEDRRSAEMFGGKALEIQQLYAAPGIIHKGDRAQVCYGVANAKNVKMDPPSGPVWPSYSRCLDVSPSKDTTYTLTIDDGAGHEKSQSVEVKVR